MAANTSIEWAHHTMNPWRGCAKVSAGCKNCYAEHAAPVRIARAKGLETWGAGAAREIASESMWRQPLLWNRKAKEAGERHRVFCASLADVFEDYQGPSAEAVKAARLRLWALIEATPSLDWLLLTKRPHNVLGMIPDSWRAEMPRNVWMGCTVENQEAAEERMLWLLDVPARVRFVSQEPQVGPVDWTHIDVIKEEGLRPGVHFNALTGYVTGPDEVLPRKVDWIIVGGESGHNARPFDVAWARKTVAQCKAAGVPVFVKQLGARPIGLRADACDACAHGLNLPASKHGIDCPRTPLIRDGKGGDMSDLPEDLRVREVPQ